MHRTWTGPIELGEPKSPEEAAIPLGVRQLGHGIMRRHAPDCWMKVVEDVLASWRFAEGVGPKFRSWMAVEQQTRFAAANDQAVPAVAATSPPPKSGFTPHDQLALAPEAAGGGQTNDGSRQPNPDNSPAGLIRYAVKTANQTKVEVERELLTLGELTDKDAKDEDIERQYTRVAKALAEYENWLTQAFLADERYVSETSALFRDEQLQASVLSLTLTPAGLPVSNAAHDAWKQHEATLDEQLRKSDARLAAAQKWVRAVDLVGAVAGIAAGGIETAAAEGAKEAGEYVAKEAAKLLLREAVDYALQKLAEKGGAAGRDAADKIQRARFAYFLLRATGGRVGKLAARSDKSPKRPVGKAKADGANKTAQGTMGGPRGLTPRNAHLAGRKHPETGIPFDKDGYPVFSSVAIRTVEIKQSGNRAADYAAANKAAGYSSTPKGYTWHHHQDGKTMQLVPTTIHKATGHTGGVAIQKHTGAE